MPDALQPAASVSDVLGGAAEPPRIRWRDAEYPVAPPTLLTLTRLEVLIADAAGAEVDALQGTSRHARLEKELDAQLIARAHRTGGELWNRYMSSPDGAILYLLALLREKNPALSEADARQMAGDEPGQVRRAVALVTPDFLKLAGAKAGANPDQIAAALRQLPPG